MVKIIIFITIVCFGLAIARSTGERNNGESDRKHGGDGSKGRTTAVPPSPCSNVTAIQSYVTNYQTLITTLTNNGSFANWLNDHAQETAYIQSADKTSLLASNCTGYLSGLDAARTADRAAHDLREQYYRIAEDSVRQLDPNCKSSKQDHDDDHGRRH